MCQPFSCDDDGSKSVSAVSKISSIGDDNVSVICRDEIGGTLEIYGGVRMLFQSSL